MRFLKIIILLFCLILTNCTSSSSCNQTEFTDKFDCQMDKAKRYCLDQGFIGHEPEYRSCVISKSSQLFNLQVKSSLSGD